MTLIRKEEVCDVPELGDCKLVCTIYEDEFPKAEFSFNIMDKEGRLIYIGSCYVDTDMINNTKDRYQYDGKYFYPVVGRVLRLGDKKETYELLDRNEYAEKITDKMVKDGLKDIQRLASKKIDGGLSESVIDEIYMFLGGEIIGICETAVDDIIKHYR